MGLRRGFKAEANGYSRELRRELGLAAHSPLCPWKLATFLDLPVVALESYVAAIPEAVAYLRGDAGRSEFSAITVCCETRRIIVYNDAHSRKRQAADIFHEIGHTLLHHPPPSLTLNGSRYYDPEIEEEAHWLGFALHISDEAALLIARRNYTLVEASDLYGASEQMVQMRLNVTGAYRRIRGWAA